MTRYLLAALLVISSALFAVGTAIERHDIKKEKVAEGRTAGSTEGSTTESGAEIQGESAAHRAAEHGSEKVFGINTESVPLVIAAVAVSVVLAVGVLTVPGSVLLLLVVLALGLVFAAFDIREAVHQANESRNTVEIIAICVATLHLVVAGVAALLLSRTRPRPTPA